MSKKLLVSLAAVLLVLAGCAGDKNVTVSNPTEALITVGEKTITKGETYDTLVAATGINTIMTIVQNTILDTEVPRDEELEAEATEMLETYQNAYGSMFDYLLSYYGYTSAEEFYENALVPNIRMDKLCTNYITENFTTYASDYQVKKASVLTFASLEEAQNALASYESGTSIEDLAATASDYSLDTVITNLNADLDANAVAYATEATEVGMSSALQGSDGTSGVLVYVSSVDPTEFEEDAVNQIISDSDDIQNEVLIAYLEKYDFTLYDLTTYTLFQDNYPEYIVQK